MSAPKQMGLALVFTTVALVSASCGPKGNDGRAGSSEAAEPLPVAEVGITYKANKGLLVAPTTANYIGLQVADVEERTIASLLTFPAQVCGDASAAPHTRVPGGRSPGILLAGNVSPADASMLREGQTASVRTGDAGAESEGRIIALRRDLEGVTAKVEVLLAVADLPPSGVFVTVTVPLGGDRKVVSAPRSALLRTSEGDFVYTASGDHFMRAPVKLGLVNPDFVELTDGIYAGDQIVVQPVMTLWLAELQSLRGGKACADGH